MLILFYNLEKLKTETKLLVINKFKYVNPNFSFPSHLTNCILDC